MIIVNHDGSVVHDAGKLQPHQLQRGYTELAVQPGTDLSHHIEELLTLAFDALGLNIFEMRVREERPV